MTTPTAHDCYRNREPICPYCGHVKRDAWELHLAGDGATTEIDCGKCDETYEVCMNVEVSYTTGPVVAQPQSKEVP